MQAFAIEDGRRFANRHEQGVVEIKTQELALRLHHANDAEAVLTDSNPCAEWIGVTEEFPIQLGAEDCIGLRIFIILRRQETPDRHLHPKGMHHVGGYAEHHRAAQALAELDLGVALNHRHHAVEDAQPLQGPRIFNRQRTVRRNLADRATHRAGLARLHADQIGAELGELADHELTQAFAKRGQ